MGKLAALGVTALLMAALCAAQSEVRLGPQQLRVVPADLLIARSSTLQYHAFLGLLTGTAEAGAETDITNDVTWSSSDTNIADINPQNGLVTSSSSTGQVFISLVSGPFRLSVPLTVSNATLNSISINPASASVPLGRRQQFTATGHYNDSTTHDLTTAVTWTSDATSVATVSILGLASSHAQSPPPANISASFGGMSGSAALTVVAPVLDFIEINPPNATLVIGTPIQYAATGHYSDGSTQSLTSTVTFPRGNLAPLFREPFASLTASTTEVAFP